MTDSQVKDPVDFILCARLIEEAQDLPLANQLEATLAVLVQERSARLNKQCSSDDPAREMNIDEITAHGAKIAAAQTDAEFINALAAYVKNVVERETEPYEKVALFVHGMINGVLEFHTGGDPFIDVLHRPFGRWMA